MPTAKVIRRFDIDKIVELSSIRCRNDCFRRQLSEKKIKLLSKPTKYWLRTISNRCRIDKSLLTGLIFVAILTILSAQEGQPMSNSIRKVLFCKRGRIDKEWGWGGGCGVVSTSPPPSHPPPPPPAPPTTGHVLRASSPET